MSEDDVMVSAERLAEYSYKFIESMKQRHKTNIPINSFEYFIKRFIQEEIPEIDLKLRTKE